MREAQQRMRQIKDDNGARVNVSRSLPWFRRRSRSPVPRPCSAFSYNCPPSPTIERVPQTLPNPPAQVIAANCIPAANGPLDAPAPLRLWHLASLDAPTVAVVWSLAFAWAAGVHLPAWIPVRLALATWAVYIADRLLDARAALRTDKLNSLCERHLFHHRHRRLFLPIALGAACAALWIVFTQMPLIARERNSILAAAALAYFTGVHYSPRLPHLHPSPLVKLSPLVKKELLVGLLFTAACALPAFSRAAVQLAPTRGPLIAAAVVFALLAWLNCHAIDRWETPKPMHDPQIFAPACLLAFSALPLAGFLSSIQPRFAALLVAGAAGALLLAVLDRSRTRLTPLALRAGADLALLTPLALLLR